MQISVIELLKKGTAAARFCTAETTTKRNGQRESGDLSAKGQRDDMWMWERRVVAVPTEEPEFTITAEEVQFVVQQKKERRAPGPDNLRSEIIKPLVESYG
ncbi:hypothetical protein Trydic_g9484 [Trypoxylus dichotomus]